MAENRLCDHNVTMGACLLISHAPIHKSEADILCVGENGGGGIRTPGDLRRNCFQVVQRPFAWSFQARFVLPRPIGFPYSAAFSAPFRRVP